MSRAALPARTYRWDIAPAWDGADELARQLRTGRLIAQLLANRGLRDPEAARAYLSPKLTDLHDPQLLGRRRRSRRDHHPGRPRRPANRAVRRLRR